MKARSSQEATPSIAPSLLQNAWQYLLFEALYGDAQAVRHGLRGPRGLEEHISRASPPRSLRVVAPTGFESRVPVLRGRAHG